MPYCICMGPPRPDKNTIVLSAEERHKATLEAIHPKIMEMCGGNERYAALVLYLISTMFFDKESGANFAVLPSDEIAMAWGWKSSLEHNTGDKLREFCAHFGLHWGEDGDPENDVLRHWHPEEGYVASKCRRIRIDFLSELRAMYWKELRKSRLKWVHGISGVPVVIERQKNIRPVSPDQGAVIRMLRDNPKEIYEVSDECKNQVMDLIEKEPELDRAQSEAELIRILQSPPDYLPSSKRMTHRVFAGAWSSISSEKRDLLFPGEVEVDLGNAYLGIFLKLFESNLGPSVESERLRCLLLDESPWTRILEACSALDLPPSSTFPPLGGGTPYQGIEIVPQDGGRSSASFWLTKGLLKTLSYSVVHGMQVGLWLGAKGGIIKHLNDEHSLNADQVQHILETRFFNDLLKMTRQLRSASKKAKVLRDIHGHPHRLRDHGNRFESLLARLSSAAEVELLSPVLDVTKGLTGAFVKLWQHDGLRLTHLEREKLPMFVELVVSMVDQKAIELGVLTRLVVKA